MNNIKIITKDIVSLVKDNLYKDATLDNLTDLIKNGYDFYSMNNGSDNIIIVKVANTKDVKELKGLNRNKEVLIIHSIISNVKGYGSSLLNQVFKLYKLDLFLTVTDFTLKEFYLKNDMIELNIHHGDIMYFGRYVKAKEQIIYKKPRVVIIKGNPKHMVSKLITKRFYNSLVNIITKVYDVRVELYESGVKQGELCGSLSHRDIVIGFSRGGSYASIFKKYCFAKSLFIGVGCPDYTDNDIFITNPKDNTSSGDMSTYSLKEHWTLTKDMKKELLKVLRLNKMKYNIAI